MNRSPRELYVSALDVLLRGETARIAHSRDWELLREISRLAASDAPIELAATDPALFQSWRAAVTRFHVAGWSAMTPERIDQIVRRLSEQHATTLETQRLSADHAKSSGHSRICPSTEDAFPKR